jgi:site-specific recombinase XerC
VVGERRHHWADRVCCRALRSDRRCLIPRANHFSRSEFQVCNTSPQRTFTSQGQQQPVIVATRAGTHIREWSDFYLENFSRPPFRTPKTHEVNQRALRHLRTIFENTRLAELTPDDIEMFLRQRLKQRVQVRTGTGFIEKELLKATTVHQEFRVLRRMLNVAVRKKFVAANPCSGVEFPEGRWTVPAALYGLVRAAENRVQRAGIPKERDPYYYRDRTPGL